MAILNQDAFSFMRGSRTFLSLGGGGGPKDNNVFQKGIRGIILAIFLCEFLKNWYFQGGGSPRHHPLPLDPRLSCYHCNVFKDIVLLISNSYVPRGTSPVNQDQWRVSRAASSVTVRPTATTEVTKMPRTLGVQMPCNVLQRTKEVCTV